MAPLLPDAILGMATSRLNDRRHGANGFTKLSSSILGDHRRTPSKKSTWCSIPSLHSASSDDDVANPISTNCSSRPRSAGSSTRPRSAGSSRPQSAGSSTRSPSCSVPSLYSPSSDDRVFNRSRTSCNSRPRSAGSLRPRSAGSSTRSTTCSGPSVYSPSSDDRAFTNRTNGYSRPRSAGSSQSSPMSSTGSTFSVPPLQPIWSSDGSLISHEKAGWIATASNEISCASSSRASSPRRLGDAWGSDSSRPSSTGSAAKSSAQKWQAREDLLKQIRSMQPSETHKVLEHIRALRQSQSQDFTCVCEALVRRVSDLIKRTPVHALCQADDMVKAVHEFAMLQQSSSSLVEKLEHALEERLESHPERCHSLESCVERYEQASQLCAASLIRTRCLEDAIGNIGHWLDCTPMMQLKRKVLQLAHLAHSNEVILGLLLQRFHTAAIEIASASSEEMTYFAQAIIDFQANGIMVFGSESLKHVVQHLENCLKTWPVEHLRQEFDPSTCSSSQLFCEASPLIQQSVCTALSKRLKRLLMTLLNSLQEKHDLIECEAKLEIWHEIANHGVRSGILRFSVSTRDAVIRAFTDCLDAVMERDSSGDNVQIVLRMQARVLDIMVNGSERAARIGVAIIDIDS